ncbi:molybdopterin synthase sulfur carrier subunit [Roseibium aquae]|uniref:Molybdopterin synthase sulfur carrier subunit n=1 Tax=Roseibium aquae TaxID=1323746 RepID=A0A916T971_9HYPH|nr:molybdopterin converting factor subunit 1 [Roseibium aquae]GGB35108.1 molybdopterin synthase sulfur carrier subunit [Roseibium aquae]
MQIRYFAWVRERVGLEQEELDLPAGIQTVGDLINHLKGLDDNHAAAFADQEAVRVAVDQEHADADRPLAGAREIAFFPPMTGG